MTKRVLLVLCLLLATGWLATNVDAAPPPAATRLEDITSMADLQAALDAFIPADAADYAPVGHEVTAHPPAAWASVLERELEDIHPPDDRVRLSPAQTEHVYLSVAWDNYNLFSTCSGAFIGPRVVLTAAHCIYDQELGIWADDAVVVPGKDDTIEPLGYVFSTIFYVPNGFINHGGGLLDDLEFDFGIIVLDTDLGNSAGMLTPASLPFDELTDANLAPFTIGYPGDKPDGTQWHTAEKMLVDVDSTFIYSRLDIMPGQSGSPVMRGSDGLIFAVVSATLTFWDDSYLEISRRINEDTFVFLNQACAASGCTFNTYTPPVEPEPPIDPESEPPTPPKPPVDPPVEPPKHPSLPHPDPVGPNASNPAFSETWARTDLPVSVGDISRTWMWGPQPFTDEVYEPYAEAPGGKRVVLYYDKSRMEITNPHGDTGSIWFVTNGLLVNELITGRLQLGDNLFEEYSPANVNVAGDSDDPIGPTYATFATVLDNAPLSTGTIIVQTIDRAGNIATDPNFDIYNVHAAHHVPETNHTVASVFWDFMLEEGQPFGNPFYATGYPTTEAYWATVKVAGHLHPVLIQVFERRVLTYTPGNPPGWQVEAGNVGQHYYTWRYGEMPN